MGWLLRVLLILIVIYFILSKFEKMFRRMFGSNTNHHHRKRDDQDLHIDYRSRGKKGSQQHHDYNGGEYVDYEEVD